MKKQFGILICVGVVNLILFFIVFKLFQHEKIYKNTIGVFSQNYERTGDWDNYEIKKVSKPFVQIKNDHFNNWDADIYRCISERMYSLDGGCYSYVRAAFFPLFPIMWKLSHFDSLGISIINYLFFICSIAFLIVTFLNTSFVNRLIAFVILISLPSTISYVIPYTESLFLFTMVIAIFGILKKKYWIYFIGVFLLAMVRPAAIFVFFAIIFAEILIGLQQKRFWLFIKEITLKSLPFVLGYLCAITIQYLYSGSWMAIFNSRKYWSSTIFYNQFSDWSVEGFGLSIFAAFFICLPAIGFVLSLVLLKNKESIIHFKEKIKNHNTEYLFLISIVYFIGIFLFTILTQGLNFHSFSRYILASPLFYIATLFLLNYLFNSNKSLKIICMFYSLLTIAVFIFLRNVEYGGERFDFSFLGLYLFIITGLYLIIVNKLHPRVQLIMTFGFIIINTIWNTYLLNAFFCNSWIFT